MTQPEAPLARAVTHHGVGEVYVAQGVGNFDPGDLLIYDRDGEGLRTYHPKGTWAEYTVTPDGTCRVLLCEHAKVSGAEHYPDCIKARRGQSAADFCDCAQRREADQATASGTGADRG